MMSLQYVLLPIVAIALIAGVSSYGSYQKATVPGIVSDAGPPKKLVGGFAPREHEFRFTAIIRKYKVQECGATIVHKRHVITAARCVKHHSSPYKNIDVMTGVRLDTSGVRSAIKAIMVHPQYDPTDGLSPHDIAIIRLKKDIAFVLEQTIAELPYAPPSPGLIGRVAGWGISNPQKNWYPRGMTTINSTVLSYEECTTRARKKENIFENYQLCALPRRGMGLCDDDEGGPLMYNNQLIGIASWFEGCASGYPDVYTNVYHYLPWIREMMARKTLISSGIQVCELRR